MTKRTMSMLDAHATLTAEVTEAVKKAAAAGLEAADIAAVLTKIAELAEQED